MTVKATEQIHIYWTIVVIFWKIAEIILSFKRRRTGTRGKGDSTLVRRALQSQIIFYITWHIWILYYD